MSESSELTCPDCGRELEALESTPLATCPNCGAAIRIGRKNIQGRDMAQQLSIEQRTAILEQHIGQLVRHGYRVISRTETTAQLVKPKEFSLLWALLWLGVTLCVFGLGILIYLFYYLAQKDKTVYLEVDPYGQVNVTPQWARRLIEYRRPTETKPRKHTIPLVLGLVVGIGGGGLCLLLCVIGGLIPQSPSYYATRTATIRTTRTAEATGTATRVPPAVSAAVPTPSHFTYVVQSGDTLSGIAADFGTSVEAIMDLNGLTSTTIYSGTQLLMPRVGAPIFVSPTASTQASTPTRQASPTLIQQYRGVYIGMPADDVLQVWGKGLRTELLGQDSEGLIVAWVYEDARLIMKRSWLGGTYQYRVSEILLR